MQDCFGLVMLYEMGISSRNIHYSLVINTICLLLLLTNFVYSQNSNSNCYNVFPDSIERNHEEFCKAGEEKFMKTQWSPFQMKSGKDNDFENHTLFVLNAPTELSPKAMALLWNKAIIQLNKEKTDHWYRFMMRHVLQSARYGKIMNKSFPINNGKTAATVRNKEEKIMNKYAESDNDIDMEEDDFKEFIEEGDNEENKDLKEGNEEDEQYNFFTFSSIMWHFVIFMACFLLY